MTGPGMRGPGMADEEAPLRHEIDVILFKKYITSFLVLTSVM